MNSENKIYKINYLEHEDKFGGMYKSTRDRLYNRTADRYNKAAASLSDSYKNMQNSISNNMKSLSNFSEWQAVETMINGTLGRTQNMGVNCNTIPILIEHLIRKYLISSQCTNNTKYNKDFITNEVGEGGYRDDKFLKIIYEKMIRWLDNSGFEDEKRLVNGGGLYNLDIEVIVDITEEGGITLNDNMLYNFNKARFLEMNGNNDRNSDFYQEDADKSRKKKLVIKMSDYFDKMNKRSQEEIEEIDEGLVEEESNPYKVKGKEELKSKSSIISRIIKILEKEKSKTILKKGKMQEIKEIAVQKENKKLERKRINLKSYYTSSKKKECEVKNNGDWDGKACYEKISSEGTEQLPLEQAQLEEVPLQQIPIQQIPIQQMPIQQIPIQQIPIQQVQMIPVQMGGISDESDYLVKKELGTKGFKKLKNGIKKLFDEFNESEQVNLLKEKDSNLLEYMVWNYGLKQNI